MNDKRKYSLEKKNKKLNKILFWVLIANVILWPTAILLAFYYYPSSNTSQTSAQTTEQQQTKKVDYERLLRENTKTLNAGKYKFEDKFKDPSFFKVRPSNPKTSGNFFVYDADGNIITNEILDDGTYGVRECITVLDKGFSIEISGIDRVMFAPVVTGGVPPKYETKTMVPGYHSVGHTVAAGRYVISPANRSSGNFFVYRGNNLAANEILGGDMGVSSYTITLQDDDLIYTSGVYITLSIIE